MKLSELEEFNVNDWLTDRETKQAYLHHLMSDVLDVPPDTTIVDGAVLQRLADEVRRHVRDPAVLALVDRLSNTSWPRLEAQPRVHAIVNADTARDPELRRAANPNQ